MFRGITSDLFKLAIDIRCNNQKNKYDKEHKGGNS